MANLLENASNWKDANNASPPAVWNGSAYVFAAAGTLTLTATAAQGDTLTADFTGTEQNQGHQIAINVNGADAIAWSGAGASILSFPTSIAITLNAGDTVQIVTQNDACGYAPDFTMTPPAKVFDCDEPIIEVWQPPAIAYNVRIRAYAQSTAFAADTDKTLVDSRLVFLMALANMKAHYGQPDANAIANQLQLRLRKLRARSHNDQRYRRQDDWMAPPMPKISNPDAFN